MIGRASFVGGALSLFATRSALAQSASTSGTVRVGAPAADGSAEAYYATDLGLFSKAGLNVTISSPGNSSQLANAVVGGAIDIAITSPLVLANAFLHGIPVVYIAGGAMYTNSAPGITLGVARTNPIKTAKEFEGQTVSVGDLRGPTHLALLEWLAKNGADWTKVRVVEIPASAAGQALVRGTVAGSVFNEPFLSAAIAHGDARLFGLPFGAIGNNFMMLGWFATTAWTKQNPEIMKRFTSVIYETARWANANHDLSGKILQKYSQISDDTLRLMQRFPYATSLDSSMFSKTLELAAKYKFTDRPVAASELIAKDLS